MAATSLKQLLQSMQIDSMDMVEGTVTKQQPLEITITNDEKNVATEENLYVPNRLTDYEVEVTIPESGSHSQYSGSGTHSHTKVKMKVYNALKKGDKLHLISFNRGKQYYVLDRM